MPQPGPLLHPTRSSIFDGVSGVLADFRHAVRSLRVNPAFSLVAITTLALGIAASVAGFTLANWLVLRPTPGVRDAARVYVNALSAADNQLLDAIETRLAVGVRAEYDSEAARELAPFRSRMTEDAYNHARRAVVWARLKNWA